MLDGLTKKCRVDKSRIYLTGLSLGGTGTWIWALGHPERFAAVLPLCGTGIAWAGFRLKDTPV